MKPSDVLSWRSSAQRRRLAGGLSAVEERLRQVVGLVPGRLAEAADATLAAGGKRLRPLLVLLAARNTGPLDGPVLRAAAAVELLHMATLVHDDVLDGADLRRGLPTVAKQYGDDMAVSTGDFLLAQAFAELSATADRRAVALLSEVAWGLSEGERLQALDAFNLSVGVDDYLRRCRLKTADLFSAACRLGALLTGLSDETVEALGAFGDSLGLAFQILDDIIDLTGDEAVTGKRRGADLRDGTVTLPIVLALEARPEIGPRLEGCRHDETSLAGVLDEVLASGGAERAREIALQFMDEARRRLADCPGGFERELLDELAVSLMDRYS
ncbi:MAG TPA: polyprenyl synthetase family protein [Thermoleophilia bacterium]|nr:polyprenyl synthetase family protein [Thermoleophilia bacterium]